MVIFRIIPLFIHLIMASDRSIILVFHKFNWWIHGLKLLTKKISLLLMLVMNAAFDLVDHALLIQKLNKLGLSWAKLSQP